MPKNTAGLSISLPGNFVGETLADDTLTQGENVNLFKNSNADIKQKLAYGAVGDVGISENISDYRVERIIAPQTGITLNLSMIIGAIVLFGALLIVFSKKQEH